mmetsp:Transcript_53561/g.148544  ORF Transcript_53561/g.148544 Transcript_53561/m.148544 type:complete len:288 (+) Transcript_53561:277-1140(+)
MNLRFCWSSIQQWVRWGRTLQRSWDSSQVWRQKLRLQPMRPAAGMSCNRSIISEWDNASTHLRVASSTFTLACLPTSVCQALWSLWTTVTAGVRCFPRMRRTRRAAVNYSCLQANTGFLCPTRRLDSNRVSFWSICKASTPCGLLLHVHRSLCTPFQPGMRGAFQDWQCGSVPTEVTCPSRQNPWLGRCFSGLTMKVLPCRRSSLTSGPFVRPSWQLKRESWIVSWTGKNDRVGCHARLWRALRWSATQMMTFGALIAMLGFSRTGPIGSSSLMAPSVWVCSRRQSK